MALDEALLVSGPAAVTLRFYTWSPDTLSLGYFQRLTDVPPAARFQSGERGAELPGAVCRRLTGGGAIHHTGELTFSISAPLTHPLYRGPIEGSYRRVHAAIAAALRAVGVHAEERGGRVLDSEREATGMCFHKSASVDLVWDGKKGVGSAQRRKGERVLHHGSIKLDTTALEGDIATLGAGLTAEELVPHCLTALQTAFGMRAEKSELRAVEAAHIEERAAFFTSAAFVGRR
jgi:lipoate-protein ligase A